MWFTRVLADVRMTIGTTQTKKQVEATSTQRYWSLCSTNTAARP